jgi:hypothetical protein
MSKAKAVQKRAAEKGASGRRLSAAKQSLRDTLIVTRKAMDWPNAAIATEAGVTERQVLRVLKDRQALGQALLDRDPIDVVQTMATQLQASVGDFEAMASAYGERNPAAAIGAKKGADQAREKLLLLLQATGRLPRDMGVLGDILDMREIAEQMVSAVRAFRRCEMDAETVEAVFTAALGVGRPQGELAGGAR